MSRRYRFKFDQDGYYAGLAYPIEETTLGPVYEPNTSEIEPFWKDGFNPRFDFKLNYWILEPKAEKSQRLAVEREIIADLETRLAERHQVLKDHLTALLCELLTTQKRVSHVEFVLEESNYELRKDFAKEIASTREAIIANIDANALSLSKQVVITEDSLTERIKIAIRYLTPIRQFFIKLFRF